MRLKGRLGLLDAFRGMAALMVVLFHLVGAVKIERFDEVSRAIASVFSLGYVGVDLFFVISGFVICMSLDRYAPSWQGFRGFMQSRLVRLSPPYWALIAYVTVEYWLDGRFSALADIWKILSNLLYVQNLSGQGDLVPVFWTLCYEMQFYLLFGVSYLLLARNNLGAPALWFQWLLFLGALISLYGFFIERQWFWDGLMLGYFHFFALGIFLYWVLNGLVHPGFLAGLWLAFLALYLLGDRHAIRIAAWVFSLFLFVVLHYRFEMKWLQGRLLLHLGAVSYSLYLAHSVFGWKAVTHARRLFEEGNLPSFVLLITLGVAGSYLATLILYWLVEKPAIRWGKGLNRRPAEPLACAVS